MPTFLQASISSEPAGAVIFFPSTVRFTSGIGLSTLAPALPRRAFSNGHGLPSKWSSNSFLNFFTNAMVGIAAASPSGQKVFPSMFSAR